MSEFAFYATKKGNVNVFSWKRRWFVCNPSAKEIRYYSSDNVAKRAKGTIHVAGVTRVSDTATTIKALSGRNFHLVQHTTEDGTRLLATFGSEVEMSNMSKAADSPTQPVASGMRGRKHSFVMSIKPNGDRQ